VGLNFNFQNSKFKEEGMGAVVWDLFPGHGGVLGSGRRMLNWPLPLFQAMRNRERLGKGGIGDFWVLSKMTGIESGEFGVSSEVTRT